MPSPLQTLFELSAQVDADKDSDPEQLHIRDRAIAQKCAYGKKRALKQILFWLEQLEESRGSNTRSIASSAEKIITFAVILAALLLGASLAGVVFRYDGSQPINILLVFAVLVILPFLGSLFSLLSFLPEKIVKILPPVRLLVDFLASINPGRLRNGLVKILPQRHRESLNKLLAFSNRHQRLFGRYQRWTLFYTGQIFTLAILIGATAYFLVLVTTSDLAFGWSTTLGIESKRIHKAAQVLSRPWNESVPSAVPSLELIEQSRYFRFKDGTLGQDPSSSTPNPQALGAWWQFLLLSILAYGILPRIFLSLLTSIRRDAACIKLIVNFPGVDAVIWRLNSSLVSTHAESSPDQARTAPTPIELQDRSSSIPVALFANKNLIINWAGTCQNTDSLSKFISAQNPLAEVDFSSAGGKLSLSDDQLSIDRAKDLSSNAQVYILVRSWEPPTEELIDFVIDIRDASSKELLITVLPLGDDKSSSLCSGTSRELEIWQRRISQVGDPYFVVKQITEVTHV